MAAIISLAITGSVNGSSVLITFAYALGTSIPMLLIVWGGRNLLNRAPFLIRNTEKIQRGFGVLMVITVIAILFGYDRKFQTFILDKFPSYGLNLTRFEDNQTVKSQLEKLNSNVREEDTGKPLNELIPKGNPAPELIQGGDWFNSDPLTIAQLRGKVVLVDFWTYTCINCIRTLSYLRSWHEKYSDKGLVIIGVHTPEFEFEKSAVNVSQAIADYELKYAVMQDNNFATWRAYNNRYWPAKYLINKNGIIRYTHFGEGAYDKTERVIQELLKEAGQTGLDEQISNHDYDISARTQELYLGYQRMQYFVSPEDVVQSQKSNYTVPQNLAQNNFAFVGSWTINAENSTSSSGAKLVLNFEAKDVYLVMRPESEGGQVSVMLDGKFIGEAEAGKDVTGAYINVAKDMIYHIVSLSEPGKHLLEVQFLDQPIEIFAFTFG